MHNQWDNRRKIPSPIKKRYQSWFKRHTEHHTPGTKKETTRGIWHAAPNIYIKDKILRAIYKTKGTTHIQRQSYKTTDSQFKQKKPEGLEETHCKFSTYTYMNTRLLYSGKLWVLIEGKRKILHGRKRQKDYMATKLRPHRILEEMHKMQKKDKPRKIKEIMLAQELNDGLKITNTTRSKICQESLNIFQ